MKNNINIQRERRFKIVVGISILIALNNTMLFILTIMRFDISQMVAYCTAVNSVLGGGLVGWLMAVFKKNTND